MSEAQYKSDCIKTACANKQENKDNISIYSKTKLDAAYKIKDYNTLSTNVITENQIQGNEAQTLVDSSSKRRENNKKLETENKRKYNLSFKVENNLNRNMRSGRNTSQSKRSCKYF